MGANLMELERANMGLVLVVAAAAFAADEQSMHI
jgi:hypothetical protein